MDMFGPGLLGKERAGKLSKIKCYSLGEGTDTISFSQLCSGFKMVAVLFPFFLGS